MVPYVVKRSRRARYLQLTLTSDRSVVISVPGKTSEKEALRFLAEQGEWLARHVGPARGKRRTLLSHLERKPWLSAGGVRNALEFGFTRKKPSLEYSDREGRVRLHMNTNSPVESQVKSLLRAFANTAIRDRTLELAARIDLGVARVGVRDQSQCWGSCSHKGTLSFNWRLLLLTPKLHDYIILHELAHLTHMNHSEEYWKTLSSYDRAARSNDARVSKASPELMPLGRSDG